MKISQNVLIFLVTDERLSEYWKEEQWQCQTMLQFKVCQTSMQFT